MRQPGHDGGAHGQNVAADGGGAAGAASRDECAKQPLLGPAMPLRRLGRLQGIAPMNASGKEGKMGCHPSSGIGLGVDFATDPSMAFVRSPSSMAQPPSELMDIGSLMGRTRSTLQMLGTPMRPPSDGREQQPCSDFYLVVPDEDRALSPKLGTEFSFLASLSRRASLCSEEGAMAGGEATRVPEIVSHMVPKLSWQSSFVPGESAELVASPFTFSKRHNRLASAMGGGDKSGCPDSVDLEG